MKRFALLLGCLLAPALVRPAAANAILFTAVLTGPAEFPPNASPGLGTATVTVDLDLDTMRVEVIFFGLLGNVTASHIHCCTAVPGSGAAGVATQVPTFTGFPSGVMAGSYDHTFDMTLASSFNPAFIAAHGGVVGQAFDDLLAGMEGGNAYLNIHTNVFPGGEIRGFLQPVPEPATVVLTAIGLAGLGAWRKRRPLP